MAQGRSLLARRRPDATLPVRRDYSMGVFASPREKVQSRGCKPKPPKIPSPQLQPRHDRIQVDELSLAREGIAREDREREIPGVTSKRGGAPAVGGPYPECSGGELEGVLRILDAGGRCRGLRPDPPEWSRSPGRSAPGDPPERRRAAALDGVHDAALRRGERRAERLTVGGERPPLLPTAADPCPGARTPASAAARAGFY